MPWLRTLVAVLVSIPVLSVWAFWWTEWLAVGQFLLPSRTSVYAVTQHHSTNTAQSSSHARRLIVRTSARHLSTFHNTVLFWKSGSIGLDSTAAVRLEHCPTDIHLEYRVICVSKQGIIRFDCL